MTQWYNEAKEISIYIPGGMARCRSKVEAHWGLYLNKCDDVAHVEHEPHRWKQEGAWIPDYLITMWDERKYLAEVKYDKVWSESQFLTATELLVEHQHDLAGVLLLTDGGFIYRYWFDPASGGVDVDEHRARWTDLLTLWRTRKYGAYLADPSHPFASEATKAAFDPPWRLFPAP